MAAVFSGNVARRKLADISNLPVQQLLPDGKLQSTFTKDYEQLLKEKLQLMKILADRNKIIEVTGIELQKLRINQQKMQEQNKHFAQSNSQLLAEINAITEKVRALQHELNCKNAFFKALQRELESQVKVNVSEEKVTLTAIENRIEVPDKEDTFKRRIPSKSLGPSRQLQSKEKTEKKRALVRRQSARFKSEETESTEDLCEMPDTKLVVCPPPPSDSVLEDGDKQDTFKRRIHSKSLGPSRQLMAGNKRACVRRQSDRFKSEEAESSEDLCEMPETKLALCAPPSHSVLEDGVVTTVATVKDEDEEEKNSALSSEQLRLSIGRPSRVAAQKVQSYKEITLKVKMRRPD